MEHQPKTFSGKGLLERFAMAIVIAFLLATPLLFYTAFRAIQNKTNQVEDWLPETYTETDDLIWFREHFVSDQFVVVSWDGCRLGGDPSRWNAEPDDPRIEQLARLLVPNEAENDTSHTLNETDKRRQNSEGIDQQVASRYFKSVTTGRRLLDRLTSEPTDIRYGSAVNRLKGNVIGYDEHQTCVIVTLTDEAIVDLRKVVSRGTGGWLQFQHPEGLLLQAMRACDIDPDSAYLGGPPIDSVAIDEEGELTLYRLATLAAIVGLTLAWWSLRSIILTMIVFACGMMSAVASLSVVWLTGETTDSFLLSMPALVYVLAISGAVHLVKYYRDAIHSTGMIDAPRLAIRHGWKPTLLCSVTTAIGLLALLTSELTPIRKFGMYSAAGVMLMLITLFVFLPAALHVFPVRGRIVGDESENPKATTSDNSDEGFHRLDRFWQWFGGGIIKRHVLVTVVCGVLIGVVGLGVLRIKTNIDLMKLFDSQAQIRQDYQWLESNVGRLVPIEVVLTFDARTHRKHDGTDIDWQRYELLKRIETVYYVQRLIDSRFGRSGEDLTSRPVSAATFLPLIPKDRKNVGSITRRSIMNARFETEYQALKESGYLAVDPISGDELWRISVRVAAFKDVDYGEFTKQLQEVVRPYIEHHNAKLTAALALPVDEGLVDSGSNNDNSNDDESFVSVTYTGVIPIVYKAQRALLESLIESTFWSFITITPLLMIVSRGFRAGIAATLPNTLPVLVVFGGMGWLGVSVTIGSMMSASIALGVAVDDTIHYLIWFRNELDRTHDRNKACLAAYRRCATPTLQAALISGFGLSVFGFSTFTPTGQFGLLMLTILIAGVIAELVLLPALLAGPLGRAFEKQNKQFKDSLAVISEASEENADRLEESSKNVDLTKGLTTNRLQ